MEIKANRAFKIIYCLTLLGFLPLILITGNGWIGLMTGFNPGLIAIDLVLLFISCRLVVILLNPTALDSYAPSRINKITRAIGVFLIAVGFLGMAGLLFTKPITLLLLRNAGEDGIGYLVVGMMFILIASLAIPGIIIFELTRFLGARSQQLILANNTSSFDDDQPRDYSRRVRWGIALTFLCWIAFSIAAPHYIHHKEQISSAKFEAQMDAAFHDHSIPSQDVPLEILDKTIYQPALVIDNNRTLPESDWDKLASDKKGWAFCQTLLNQTMPGGWVSFKQDETKQKKAKYSSGPICRPDGIWFKDYTLLPGKMVLTKYTLDGDFVYRISFTKPDIAGTVNGLGYIQQPTFKEENGYLYFEWWNSGFRNGNSVVDVFRVMKVRLLEPTSTTANSSE